LTAKRKRVSLQMLRGWRITLTIRPPRDFSLQCVYGTAIKYRGGKDSEMQGEDKMH